MKKVTNRAAAVLLLMALIIVGMGVYIFRLVRDGGDWASFYANDSIYTAGVLNSGTITDRNGVVLASAGTSGTVYADSASIRTACLHVVGDADGYIGTGALTAFRSRLVNYSFITGTTTGGGTVALSIDSSLNAVAYSALNGQNGTVIVYNYETGQILCMVSSPSYDPNYGFDSTSSAYDGVYLNRAISATYVPGSVFKLVTMAAAIENISDIFSQSFYCSGSTTINGTTINCSGTHGTQNVYEVLANSCNVELAEIAIQLGGDLIAEYAEAYGLTDTHKIISSITSAAGSVSSAQVDSGSTAWEGIGQYEDMINPYAFLRLMGAIANGGTVTEPSLLYGKSAGTTRLMKASTANTLAEMMAYNVENHYGTSSYPNLEMHAKTGTAELDGSSSHAWFVGFISNSDAPLAFVVMVENGGGGYSVASPIANTVLHAAGFG